MARIKKKGQAGNAKNYVTRSQAVRKLQVSLPDFRRLCIFKGIYPREPRSRKRASKSSTPSTTFYYAKDIQYLLHEPLLNKFREQKALAKKISKALGRNEIGEAARFEKNLTPKIKLDHIIKERYPTFADALRDLDDALSMLFLYANLPSADGVPPKLISRCQRLTMEFEHYLIHTHALRKSFLSIKGIYYQATIQGQDILWLIPYRFVQRAGPDVDFRIMATFVEFYTTLVGFINFRLYTSAGLVYPPRFDLQREAQGAELTAFDLEDPTQTDNAEEQGGVRDEVNQKAQAEADRLLLAQETDQSSAQGDASTLTLESSRIQDNTNTEEAPDTTLDTFQSIDNTTDSLLQPSRSADAQVASRLFGSLTFYLSRETPRHPLEFIIKAFGCKRVGWDKSLGEGAFCSEDDSRITHQVVDRPDIPLTSTPMANGEVDEEEEAALAAARKMNERVPGRIYVQPQWVWDSINAGRLQRPDLYAPGATLPPHLSPWMKPKKGEYDPTVPLAEQETEAEREAAGIESSDEEGDEVDEGSEGEEIQGVRDDEEARGMEAQLDQDVAWGEGMDVELAASSDEEDDALDGAQEQDDNDFGGFSGEEDEMADGNAKDAAQSHQAELEAEALGQRQPGEQRKSKSAKVAAIKQKQARAEKAQDEETERRKMMMSRRKRKMYEKMVYSNARRDEEAEKLRGKRRRIEKGAADAT